MLRSEVEQRRAELVAELEVGLTDKYAEHDKAWADAAFLIAEAAREANRQANDIIRKLRADWQEREIVTSVPLGRPYQERQQLHREGTARIDARVKAA